MTHHPNIADTLTDGGTDRPVGWYALGAMEAFCLEHGRTEDDVRARYAPDDPGVEPLYRSTVLRHRPSCSVCGETIPVALTEQ